MDIDLWITLGVLLATIVLFVFEIVPVGVTAMLAMAVLMASGIVPYQTALGTFGDAATVTVTAMFVLSGALQKTGALSPMATLVSKSLEFRLPVALPLLCLTVGTASAFINNTTMVALMLPIVLQSAREQSVSASKLLMPLSFCSILGGTCTLIGTSTNLVVSSLAAEHGLPAFGMFEMAPLGVIFLLIGCATVALLAPWMPPSRRTTGELATNFDAARYLADIELRDEKAPWIGKPLRDSPLLRGIDCRVLTIHRPGRENIGMPHESTMIEHGDVLRVHCATDDLRVLLERESHQFEDPGTEDSGEPDTVLVEAVVGPDSPLAGKRLRSLRFRPRFDAVPLAVRQRGRLRTERLGDLELRHGDAILLSAEREKVSALERHRDFIVVSQLDVSPTHHERIPIAVGLLVAVVLAAATGAAPIPVAATIGALLAIASGCLTQEEAIGFIDWNVVMLLAGVLTLGIALEQTGAAALAAKSLIDAAGPWGNTAVVSVLYGMTVIMTAVISNNGTAAVLTPLAIVTASDLGIDPKPLVMAVAFGASTCFLTPVGYQTNALIFGAGQYRFRDFFALGGVLTLLLWASASLLIPQIWPP